MGVFHVVHVSQDATAADPSVSACTPATGLAPLAGRSTQQTPDGLGAALHSRRRSGDSRSPAPHFGRNVCGCSGSLPGCSAAAGHHSHPPCDVHGAFGGGRGAAQPHRHAPGGSSGSRDCDCDPAERGDAPHSCTRLMGHHVAAVGSRTLGLWAGRSPSLPHARRGGCPCAGSRARGTLRRRGGDPSSSGAILSSGGAAVALCCAGAAGVLDGCAWLQASRLHLGGRRDRDDDGEGSRCCKLSGGGAKCGAPDDDGAPQSSGIGSGDAARHREASEYRASLAPQGVQCKGQVPLGCVASSG